MSALPLDMSTQAIPYSQDAEEATIGAILVNPSLYAQVGALLSPADFFILRNRYMWEAIQRLANRKDAIDYLTVLNELKAMDKLGEVGGAAYLTQLINSTPNSMNGVVYGKLVSRAAYRRQLLSMADDIKKLAFDEDLTVEDIQSDVSKRIADLNSNHTGDEDTPFMQLVSEYFGEVEELMNNPQKVRGIPTGYYDLDSMLLGLQAPDHIIVAGRPGMGKSALLLSIVMNHLEKDPNAVVGLFPLEMSKQQMTQRAAAIKSRINLKTLKEGKLSADDWRRFVNACGEIGKYKLLMDDRPKLTPDQIRAKCYRWLYKHKRLDYVVIDYLQLMSGGAHYKKDKSREQEIAYISYELKNLAKELNIPVIAAAQLNRSLESRQDKRPILSDLRESGAIEQNADIVCFVYRDEVYNEATEFPNQADIIVAKHRNGALGTVSLYFEKTITRFMNASERSIDLSRI